MEKIKVRIKDILKEFWEPDAPIVSTQSTKMDNVWKNVWENLDKKESELTNGGTQSSIESRANVRKEMKVKGTPTRRKVDKTKNLDTQNTKTNKGKEIVE